MKEDHEKEKPFDLNYYPQLKVLITGLTIEQKRITLENLQIGERGSTSEIRQEVQRLIEEHQIIFDCKESLFFKKTGNQIWIKQD